MSSSFWDWLDRKVFGIPTTTELEEWRKTSEEEEAERVARFQAAHPTATRVQGYPPPEFDTWIKMGEYEYYASLVDPMLTVWKRPYEGPE